MTELQAHDLRNSTGHRTGRALNKQPAQPVGFWWATEAQKEEGSGLRLLSWGESQAGVLTEQLGLIFGFGLGS